MIGFSIMMWFLSVILGIVSISLLRGNPSGMHGKVYETTKDRVGYAKATGKALIIITVGILASGFVALLGKEQQGLTYAMIILGIAIIIESILFIKIQKKFSSIQ